LSDKELSINEAQDIVEHFLRERGWFPERCEDRYYTLAHTMEELGELARCITHLESVRGKVMAVKQGDVLGKRELEVEIGDVLYHIFKIASAYGIRVEEAFLKSMEKNREKFPLNKYEKFGLEMDKERDL